MTLAGSLIPAAAVAAVVGVPALVVWRRYRDLKRERFIRDAPLPAGLLDRLAKRRPQFDLKQRALVAHALRQYFVVYLRARGKYVSMPSQAVDDLWHEFILFTRAYREYCDKAFGRFFDHTPAVALSPDKRSNAGLRRTWWHACKEEHIDPRHPSRLPLLFAIDQKLGIADGFVYSPDCREARARGNNAVNCAGDFGDSGVDGSTDGFGDNGTGDSGGDSGSDGGSGCGGGGCGGGGD